jgi:hypothetical protein
MLCHTIECVFVFNFVKQLWTRGDQISPVHVRAIGASLVTNPSPHKFFYVYVHLDSLMSKSVRGHFNAVA